MMPVRLILADPPWLCSDQLPGKGRGAAKKYKCMPTERIEAFTIPIGIEVAHDCLLLMWRLAAMQEDALRVVRAWGFEVKSEIVWEKETKHGKNHFGMGHYVRAAHETCLVATRGRVKVASRSVRSRFRAKVGKEHSDKPDEMYDIAERLSPGPYLELFARRRRAGWLQLGDELEQAEAAE